MLYPTVIYPGAYSVANFSVTLLAIRCDYTELAAVLFTNVSIAMAVATVNVASVQPALVTARSWANAAPDCAATPPPGLGRRMLAGPARLRRLQAAVPVAPLFDYSVAVYVPPAPPPAPGASPAPNPVLAVAARLAAALPAAFPGTNAAWSAVNDNVANFSTAAGATFLVVSSDVIVLAASPSPAATAAASTSPAATASPSLSPAGPAGPAVVSVGTALALGLGIGVGALVVAALLAVAIVYHQRVIAPASRKDAPALAAQAG